jgi:hypothetical protein
LLFCRYTKAHPSDVVESSIKAGDIVQLSDKELGGIISMAEMCTVNIKEKKNLSELPLSKSKAQGYLNRGIDDDGGYMQESLSFWQVYRFGEMSYGGALKYHEPIVLRHLVSGKFVALVGKGDEIELDFIEQFDERDKDASDFAFFFEPGLHFAGGNEVAPDAVLRLFHEKTTSYLTTHKEPLPALDLQTYTQFRAKREKVEEEDIAIRQKVVFQRKDKFTYEDVIVIRTVQDADIDDFALVNSLMPFLDLAIEATTPEKVATFPSELERMKVKVSEQERKKGYYERGGKDIIGCAILAFMELSAFVLDKDEDDDKWGESAITRQGLLQDLGVLDKIVIMLGAPLEKVHDNDLSKHLMPELQDGFKWSTGNFDDDDEGFWDLAFMVLHNSAQGEKTSTDRYLARHYKVFVKHMMYLKTEGASEVLIEMFSDNRELLDDLLDGKYDSLAAGGAGKNAGLGWILGHLDLDEDKTDFIDHDFYNFLASLCVCKEAAVPRAQKQIFNALAGSPDKKGDMPRLKERHGKGHLVKITHHKGDYTICPKTGGHPVHLKDLNDTEDGELIVFSTEESDYHFYYEVDPGNEEGSDLYNFLLSILNICSALCDGHWSDETFDPAKIVEAVASNETLIALMLDTDLPYDIRTITARLMMEMFLETPGALAVVHDEKVELVAILDPQTSQLTLASSAVTAPANEKDKKLKGYNKARVEYVTGPKHTTSADRPPPNLQVKWRFFNQKSGGWVPIQGGFTGWIAHENGFLADLQKFSREMRRLNQDEDKFEDWHRNQGEFCIRVLQQIFFAAESGYYSGTLEITNVGKTLVRGLLFYAGDLVSSQASISTVEDEKKVSLITDVLDVCLSIVDLIEIQQQQKVLGHFLRHFYNFHSSASSTEMGEKHRRGSIGAGSDESPAFEILQGMQKKAKPFLEYNYQEGIGQKPEGELKASGERDVVSYINKLHSHSSLVSETFEIKKWFKEALDVEREFVKDYNTKMQKKAEKLRETLSHRRASMKGGDNDDGRSIAQMSMMSSSTTAETGEVTASRMNPPRSIEKLEHVLIDLSRYGAGPQPESFLCRRSMKLLDLIMSKSNRMFVCGGQTRLVTEPTSINCHRAASEIIPKLHYCIYDCQITSDDESAKDITKYIKSLTELLSMPRSSGGGVVYSHQEILFRMNTLDIVLGIFDQDLDDDDYEDVNDTQNSVIEAMIEALEFVKLITRDFDDAQDRMFDEMEGLLVNPRIDRPCCVIALADALKEVFGSVKYQMKLRQSQLEELVDKLPDPGGNSSGEIEAEEKDIAHAYVDLLRAAIEPRPGSSPISRNQSIVMTALNKRSLVKGTEEHEEVIALESNYEISMVQLLSVLGIGGEVRMIESTCKNLYTVDEILTSLSRMVQEPSVTVDTSGPAHRTGRAKIHALLSFFQTTYLEDHCVTPMRFNGSIGEDARTWKIIEFCYGEVTQFTPDAQDDEKLDWLFTCVFPFFQIFFKKFFRSPIATSEADFISIKIQRAVDLASAAKELVLARKEEQWWVQNYFDTCKGTMLQIKNTFDSILAEQKLFNLESDETTLERQVQVRLHELTQTLELMDSETRDLKTPKSRASVHMHHSDYTGEEELNHTFHTYCTNLKNVYVGRDLDEDDTDDSASDSDDELIEQDEYLSHKQRGKEFETYLNLLERETVQDGIEGQNFKMLLRYLGFLEELMDDVSSTPDEKEEADILCVSTLQLLCAQLDQAGKAGQDLNDGDVMVKKAQKMHAEAGAMKHCLRLLEDDEEDLLKATMEYFIRLLNDGNVDVQDQLLLALYDSKSTVALQNIRDEIIRSVGALEINSNLTEVDELQDEEHAWLLQLIKSLHEMVEGSYTKLQDILLDQSKISHDKSVNFVDVLSYVLQRVYTKIKPPSAVEDDPTLTHADRLKRYKNQQKETDQWYDLVELVLETLAELCQGNQRNQRMVLDKRVISMLSWILAFDTTDFERLVPLTKLKRAALTVIEAMLELNNAEAKDIAFSVRSVLNLEEVYLAMNRFYYIALFTADGEPDDLLKDHADTTDKHMLHMAAGRDCYHILRRLNDLTGKMYTWSPVFEQDEAKKAKLLAAAQGSGTTSVKDFDPSMSPKQRKEAIDHFADEDEDLWDRFKDECSDLSNAIKTRKKEIAAQFGKISDKRLKHLELDADDIKRAERFKIFSWKFLSELDLHTGEHIGEVADRMWFFSATTISIEFVRERQLQKLYFCAPSEQGTLSGSIRDSTRSFLNLSSPQDKCRTLIETFDRLRLMLSRQRQLKSWVVGQLIAEGTGVYHKMLHLTTTYLINAYLIVVYRAEPDWLLRIATKPDHVWLEKTFYGVGILHMIACLLITTEFLVNNTPVFDKKQGVLYYCWQVMGMGYEFFYYVLLVVTSIAGFSTESPTVAGIGYGIHVLHLAQGNAKLERGFQAVTRNGSELLYVALMIVSVVYLLSILGFLFFRTDYNRDDGLECDSIGQCFLSTLVFGMTSGGGIREVLLPGNTMDGHFVGRIVFDLFFFIIIQIIFMNLILGIIVDTFSQLRAEQIDKEEAYKSSCFICSLPNHNFERSDMKGFEHHIKNDHNMWNYLYLSTYLSQMDEAEFSYHEKYLYETLVKDPDTTPFPIKKALALGTKIKVDTVDSKLEALSAKTDELRTMLEHFMMTLGSKPSAGAADSGASGAKDAANASKPARSSSVLPPIRKSSKEETEFGFPSN